MSKGLGKVEQQLLHEIEINPQERTVVALFNMDATEAEARRRAARSLDRKGLAVLRKTGRKGKFRSKSLLLSAKAAEEWDARVARENAEKAGDKRREAAREELEARRAIQANEGKNGRDASVLRIAISRVSGDPLAAGLFLSEVEAALGDRWHLDVLGEYNGAAQIRVVLDEK